MLLGGDEFRRTQQGNNNAYCQDNAISWFDWGLAKTHGELVRFVKRLITFRREYPVLSAERFYTEAEIEWIGAEGDAPSWHGPDNRIGCVITDPDRPSIQLCMLFNAAAHACSFGLPAPSAANWRVVIDTAQPSPADIPEEEGRLADCQPLVESRSAMVLIATD